GLHVAEVGLIGLMVSVLITAFTGITDEHRLGRAFQDAMPFTSLLVVFFAVVAVIHQQQLFSPLISWVLTLPAEQQPGM
ncbi:sodium/proton antiporter, partial [Pseudomonas sp. SIMBA_067]